MTRRRTNALLDDGKTLQDSSEGIYEDGEWTSWDWINSQLEDQELRAAYPNANPEVVRIFRELVSLAHAYKDTTERYLQVWGELGELYAEIEYGVVRHEPGTGGSDGRIGNDWVEIKTISPEKLCDRVSVKRAGNFNKLLVVKITEDFRFAARMIERARLGTGSGKSMKYKWGSDSNAEVQPALADNHE